MSDIKKLITLLENQQTQAIQANTQGQVEQQYQFLKSHTGGSVEDKTSTFSQPHPALPEIVPKYIRGTDVYDFNFQEHQNEANVSAKELGLESLSKGQRYNEYNKDITTEHQLKVHQKIAEKNAEAAGLSKYNKYGANELSSNRKIVSGERGPVKSVKPNLNPIVVVASNDEEDDSGCVIC